MPTLTTLATFGPTVLPSPPGGLFIDTAGNLFGEIGRGGNGSGSIFEIADIGGAYASNPVTISTFSLEFNTDRGNDPQGYLTTDAAGDLFGTTLSGIFGTTASGGGHYSGSVFEINNSGGTLASTAIPVGNYISTMLGTPEGGVIVDGNGNLFGDTIDGGLDADGSVFEIVNDGGTYATAPITLASFSSSNSGPSGAPLLADAAGDLFGTTSYGGSTVFEIVKTASGFASAPTTLVSFTGNLSNGSSNGAGPDGGLIMDTSGDLFGTTVTGGASDDGTVFEIVKTVNGYATTPTVLVSFNVQDGAFPLSGLLIDAAGNLFGTTSSDSFAPPAAGQSNNDGTVFELAKTAAGYAAAPITLAHFNGTNGDDPQTTLVANSAGDLFGTTNTIGTNTNGSAYEISNSGFQPLAIADTTTDRVT